MSRGTAAAPAREEGFPEGEFTIFMFTKPSTGAAFMPVYVLAPVH